MKSAIPFLIGYSAEQLGHPSVPSITKRLVTDLNDATSQVASCGLMQRSWSSSSMNTDDIGVEARKLQLNGCQMSVAQMPVVSSLRPDLSRGINPKATACTLNATEVSPGVVN